MNNKITQDDIEQGFDIDGTRTVVLETRTITTSARTTFAKTKPAASTIYVLDRVGLSPGISFVAVPQASKLTAQSLLSRNNHARLNKVAFFYRNPKKYNRCIVVRSAAPIGVKRSVPTPEAKCLYFIRYGYQ
jgi:hypothetical protein